MINPTFNLPNADRITTATVSTERWTLNMAPENVRAEFLGFFTPATLSGGWSLSGLQGKARRYKGGYYHRLLASIARYVAQTGREVGFAYDKQTGGTKRPWTRGEDGSPVWLD